MCKTYLICPFQRCASRKGYRTLYYKIGNIRAQMERLSVIGGVEGPGVYQVNHLWIITLQTAGAKLRLGGVKELSAKDKRCLIGDPDNADVCMKQDWRLFHVPGEAVRKTP